MEYDVRRLLSLPILCASWTCSKQTYHILFNPSKNQTEHEFFSSNSVWEEAEFRVWENEDRTVPNPAYTAFLEHRDVHLRNRGLTGNEPLAPQSIL